MMRLPLLLRVPRNPLVYILLWLPYIAIYQLINRFPVYEPVVLSFTWFDTATPFLPELLPLYVAYIPFFWWTVGRSRNDVELTRIFLGTHLQLALCSMVWVLYPVAMPRELFYTAASYNWADAFWRWFDAPNNCLPSLHAANCMLFVEFNWNRRYRAMHALIAAGIIASTVVVKQHYFVDAVAGGIVYAISAILLRRLALAPGSEHFLSMEEARP